MSLTRGIRPLITAALLLFCGFVRYAAGQNRAVVPDQGGNAAAAQREAPRGLPGEEPPAGSAGPSSDAGSTEQGLVLSTAAAFNGYTLYAPLNSTTTYLINLDGEVVHTWPSRYVPGQAVYLLDDGSLLRCAREPDNQHFRGGGIGGRVQRLAPDGKVTWEFVYADEHHCLHHDIAPLPNGNVLMIAWEKKTRDEAIAVGCDREQFAGDELWPDCIIEVEPQGTNGGKIVWEWHVWDHLVQDCDDERPNYGAVAAHPELVDLNFCRNAPRQTTEEIRRLRSLGYVGGGRPGRDGEDRWQPDWCHTNAVAYNAELDQIALSVHNFNEIWIIDHSTTTAQAAGHAGGRWGKGGDLLYRWGNPRAYGAGTVADQQLFAQHDVRWIPESMPGAGHLLVFNNGGDRPDGPYSSVVELDPPLHQSGGYQFESGRPFEPARPNWEYTAANKPDFLSRSISGAERLANGNTLICSGEQGRMFEVTAVGRIVWEYVNPHVERHGPPDGGPPGGGRRPRHFRDGPPDVTRPDGHRSWLGPPGNEGVDDDGPQAEGPASRPSGAWPPVPPPGGRRGQREAIGPPGAPPSPPGGHGGPPGGGVFRATRLAPDHPGVQRVLEASRTNPLSEASHRRE